MGKILKSQLGSLHKISMYFYVVNANIICEGSLTQKGSFTQKALVEKKKKNEILEKKIFWNFLKNFFSGFSLLGQETLDMGVFIYLMGSPGCEDLKKYM